MKRGKGYSVVVELGRDPATGKRRQKWHSGYSNKRAAEKALAEMVNNLHAGTFVEPTKQILGDHLEEWLKAITATIRPSTHYSYSRNIRLHVVPRLGSVQLRRVDGGMLNTLYAALLTHGKHSNKKQLDENDSAGLSPRTVRYIHTILHRAFKDAVRWGRLARNPADSADPPRASAEQRSAIATWTAEQVRAFLAHIAGHRLFAAFVLLATTGMRRGEALGLRWIDLDLDAARASVIQTVIMVKKEVRIGSPKTAAGRRTVALDPGTVAALREHRKRQAAERLLMGAGFTDHGLVFCRPDGGPLHPERFSRTFADQARQAGLPQIRLHDLRHTWATLALSAGVHARVAQERLGHSSIGITLGTYSHVIDGLHDDAAALVAGMMTGSRENESPPSNTLSVQVRD